MHLLLRLWQQTRRHSQCPVLPQHPRHQPALSRPPLYPNTRYPHSTRPMPPPNRFLFQPRPEDRAPASPASTSRFSRVSHDLCVLPPLPMAVPTLRPSSITYPHPPATRFSSTQAHRAYWHAESADTIRSMGMFLAGLVLVSRNR